MNKRNDIDFVFSLTKIVADSDSIGEGYGYCNNYTKKDFDDEIAKIIEKGRGDSYVEYAGLDLYTAYLKKINVLF